METTQSKEQYERTSVYLDVVVYARQHGIFTTVYEVEAIDIINEDCGGAALSNWNQEARMVILDGLATVA